MLQNSLYQRDIFWRLMRGLGTEGISKEDVFDTVIGSEIERICASYGCSPDINSIALLKAQRYWIEDVEGLPIEGGTDPDHFKHSGWLCHWLRKKQPITAISVEDETKHPSWFEDAPNEVCAFVIGLRLVIYHQCCLFNYSDKSIIEATKLIAYSEILPDASLYLDHKSVSPHAIYLIYRAALLDNPLDQNFRKKD